MQPSTILPTTIILPLRLTCRCCGAAAVIPRTAHQGPAECFSGRVGTGYRVDWSNGGLFAAELARVSIWIGEIQWMLNHGFALSKSPIQRNLDNIQLRDAILNPDGSEPEWPTADVIVGNPPFLGGSKLLAALDWSAIDPTIAGTLFVRSLDPALRAQSASGSGESPSRRVRK